MTFKTLLLFTGLLTMFVCCKDAGSSKGLEESEKTAGGASSADTSGPKALQQLNILYNVFNREKPDSLAEEGREVEMVDALECTSIYEPKMFDHGLERNAGIQRPVRAIVSRKITNYEVFAGKGLMDYILKMVRLLDPKGQGKHMEFQLHLGIYTDPFLEKYYRDNQRLITKKRNRITIFILPVARDTFNFKKNMDRTLTDTTIMAYELGGIQP